MTTQDALAWIRGNWKQSPYAKVIDGKLGIDVDGLFGFQCKDWANGYAFYLGNPFTSGNAIALWQLDQPGWTKVVGSPKLGDVFVKNFVANDGINYGHTGVVDEITATGFWSYDQNVVNYSLTKGAPPARIFHKFTEMLGYLRNNNLGGSMIDETTAYGMVSSIHRGITDTDPEPANADYWAKQFMANPAKVIDFANALGASDYKGDPMFRYKGRHYSEDMTTAKKQAYDEGMADAGGTGTQLAPGKYIVK
jgi:hypothetical protein